MLVSTGGEAALASGKTDVEAFAAESLADGRSVEAARTDLIAKIGENVSVRRIAAVESGGSIGHYTHGAKIGAVVALEGGDDERDPGVERSATNVERVGDDRRHRPGGPVRV